MKITNDMSIFGWKVLDEKYGKIIDDRGTLNFSPYKAEILNAVENLLNDKHYAHNFGDVRLHIFFDENHNNLLTRVYDQNNECIDHDIYNKDDYDLYGAIEEIIDLYYPCEEEEY